MAKVLPTQQAAALTGFALRRIHKLIREKALHGINVRAVQYIAKSEFIVYISSPNQIVSVQNETFKKLLREFKHEQAQRR